MKRIEAPRVARCDRSVTSQRGILDKPLASGFKSQRDQPQAPEGIRRVKRGHVASSEGPRTNSPTLLLAMQPTNHRTPTDSDADQATAALTMATHRLQTPFRDRAKRLADVLTDIDRLAAMGHNEPELRLYETAIAAKVDALFGGRTATCERTARRLELDADTREDHAQATMAIEGETPATLELNAEAQDRQSVTSRVLARMYRAKARVLREGRPSNDPERIAARQRVGLGGAA